MVPESNVSVITRSGGLSVVEDTEENDVVTAPCNVRRVPPAYMRKPVSITRMKMIPYSAYFLIVLFFPTEKTIKTFLIENCTLSTLELAEQSPPSSTSSFS